MTNIQMTSDEQGMGNFFARHASFVVHLLILFVLQCSSFVIVAEAAKLRIPAQYYRGWWYAAFPVDQPARLRIRLPYELPTSAHFHVWVLPQKDYKTFHGDPTVWPKAWIWQAGTPALIPLGMSDRVRDWGSTSMSLRVAPSALNDAYVSAHAGSTLPWGGSPPLQWKWNTVNSAFPFHAKPGPSEDVVEFRRGSRTPWLDLVPLLAGLPAGTNRVLVALAPYHDAPGGDEAFRCFPPKGATLSAPTISRQEGDYPNDPSLLWEAHQEAVTGDGRLSMEDGWSRVFGGLPIGMRYVSQFPQAWLSSVLRLTHWKPGDTRQPVSVPLTRFHQGQMVGIGRNLDLLGGSNGAGESLAKWVQSAPEVYQRMFGVFPNLPIYLGTTPPPPGTLIQFTIATMPSMNNPGVQAQLTAWRIKLDPLKFKIWAEGVENQYPGLTTLLDTWLDRYGDYYEALGTLSPGSDFATLITFVVTEFFSNPPFVLNWKGGNGLLDQIKVNNSWNSWYNVNFNEAKPVYDLFLASVGSVGMRVIQHFAPVIPPTGMDTLRRPVSWGVLAPPLFGQLRAFFTPEMANLGWRWWRASAGQLADPALLDQAGLAQNDYPWVGWFPTDQDAVAATGEWWTQYQRVPWARLMKEPTLPDPLGLGEFRFSGSTLSWIERMKDKSYWSPQPPATRETRDGERFPSLTLPTAAYPMGPIEIEWTP